MRIKRFNRSSIKFPYLLLLIILSTTACVSGPRDWPSVHGVVLEKSTGEPINDAIVVVNRIGTVPRLVQRESACNHFEVAYTDQYGKFSIPFRLEGFNMVSGEERRINIYKPALKTERLDDLLNEKTYYMEKDKSQNLQRLTYLATIIGHTGCGPSKVQREKLIELYRGVYSEAVDIAESKEEKDMLRRIRYAITSMWNDTPNTITQKEANILFEKIVKGLIENRTDQRDN